MNISKTTELNPMNNESNFLKSARGLTGSLWRINGSVLGVLVGVQMMGAAMPTLAQECDPDQTAKITAVDGFGGDLFGAAVSASGNTVVIGAQFDDDNGTNSGSAYVYRRNSEDAWVLRAKLVPPGADAATRDFFGSAVAISGDTVIVGAYGDDDNGELSGSVYIFTLSSEGWNQQAKLQPNDAAMQDFFGGSVSISGDTVVVGAMNNDDFGIDSGSAYVFTREGSVWTQQAKLLPPTGAPGDIYGFSVSISGETAVVGAFNEFSSGRAGSAYVYTRNGEVWNQQARLLADDGEAFDRFGFSVSVSGNSALIGAVHEGSGAGAAYVFTRSFGAWTQEAKLLAIGDVVDPLTADKFGHSVSISGDSAVIGAVWDSDKTAFAGSSYMYTRSGGQWLQRAEFIADDGMPNDGLGNSVSISGDTIIVGAPGDVRSFNTPGAAYIFELDCGDCPADINNDGSLNFMDIQAFLVQFAALDPATDFNEDGRFNYLDVSLFLTAFTVGCP